MSLNSPIEWTDATWNPVRGCSRISPGCQHCYAERFAARQLTAHRSPTTGNSFAIMKADGPHWTGKVELIPSMLDIPLRRKKPTTYFVNSMSDLFHEELSPSDRWKVFDAMYRAPWHTYQILTKRAKIMRHFMAQWTRILGAVPPANWWLGVSVEDNARKDRIDELRETSATVRFLSLEPLLEDLGSLDLHGIDWVIVGGESGSGARPCDVAWIRSIKDQCAAAGVACFVKQLGARPVELRRTSYRQVNGIAEPLELTDRKGGNPDEWPEGLRVRQMPERNRA